MTSAMAWHVHETAECRAGSHKEQERSLHTSSRCVNMFKCKNRFSKSHFDLSKFVQIVLIHKIATIKIQFEHNSTEIQQFVQPSNCLQFDLLVVDGDHPRPELYPDRQIMHRLEALVGELQKQA